MISALYEALGQLNPSPIVELNRAVAVSMAFGPAAGVEIVDELLGEASLKSYHLLPSVRGDLLAKLGRNAEARELLARAVQRDPSNMAARHALEDLENRMRGSAEPRQ